MARMERVRRADHSVRLLLLRKGDDDDDLVVVKESGNGAVNRMESVIRTSSTT